MRKVFGIFCFLFGSTVLAAANNYDIKMELSMNGKVVSSPRVITRAGQKAMITEKNDTGSTSIEIVAVEGEIQNHKGILMNLVVSSIDKNGKSTIIAKPQVLAAENETAQITIGDKQGKDISMSIIAKRTAQ